MSPQQLMSGRAPISSYEAGAFHFAGLAHRGALLVAPDGIYAWDAGGGGSGDGPLFAWLDEKGQIAGSFFLFGTGPRMIFPAPAFRAAIEKRGLGLEIMDTGAACRTYNVLLAEGRLFVAGLLAI